MSLKTNLSIVLITYNRLKKLKNTLNKLLDKKSPIRELEIIVLDNSSTDGTSEFLIDLCKHYKNLKHIRHPINIGGNANICRAFKYASREYIWVLCDEDDLIKTAKWLVANKIV